MLLYPLLAASLAQAATINRQLFVGNKVISPDGFSRSAVLAGFTPQTLQFPGPLIKATKGDTINVKVTNILRDPQQRRSTSIHFNGINQNGHPEFDGQSFATQCPISQNGSFTYTLNSNQAGTFLYRSGLSMQLSDGLRGPLVIYDPNDPNRALYDVDNDDTVIQLGEWYDAFSEPILANFSINLFIPIYDAGTINGVGRTNANPNVPYVVFNVVSGLRYRYRLVSIAPRAVFPFSVDQHNLTVIEADGNAVRPFQVEALELYPAQRYSVVFTANQPIGNYWLRSQVRGGVQSRNPNLNATFNKAILRYRGAPVAEPTTPLVVRPFLTEQQLHPIVDPASPGGESAILADDVWLDFQTSPTETNPNTTWRINGTAYVSPTIPTLVQILQNNLTFPESSNVFILPPNEIVQMTLPLGADGGGHPLHIHGLQFSIVKPGSTEVFNFVDPGRRDVVIVEGDTSVIRFRTPAFGIFHLNCHIIWHAGVGLQMTFVVNIPEIQRVVKPKKEWLDLCTTYNALPDELK